MTVVTVQREEYKRVDIAQGELFLLPSRIPHSPRRPLNTLGLVIEREREVGEMDRMSWYFDEASNKVETLWEKYFKCEDLGKDLVPVVQEFRATQEFQSGKRGFQTLGLHVPSCTSVPGPIKMTDAAKACLNSTQKRIDVFSKDQHPDREFDVIMESEGTFTLSNRDEIFMYQIAGSASLNDGSAVLKAGECCVIGLNCGESISVKRDVNSVGLIVCVRDVNGNRTRHPRL